jgi:hypothetical protein
MKLPIILLAAILLSGCASFKMGSFAYFAYGEVGKFEVGAPQVLTVPADEQGNAVKPVVPSTITIINGGMK